MCGINGFYMNSDFNKSKSRLKTMNDLIFHRGPDDDGVFIENHKNFNIGMGMRRLSIIDLDSGKQPMFSEDKSIVIVFNGEIYNYKILKKDLIKKFNIKFKTKSDTEVILKLYEQYGTKAFDYLDGMFAISIFDKRINKLILARDYFGEKPLYYYLKNKSIIWASELKSIIAALDNKPIISNKGLSLFFQLSYIPSPYTIYNEIFKLKPNHYIELDLKSFNYSQNIISKSISSPVHNNRLENVKNITHDLVYKSVISRSVSDVPIGAFLSGGVDSSVVSLCLSLNNNSIDTFSMGFDKKEYDESEKSDTVSKIIKSNHHKFICRESDLLEFNDDVISNYDEPFADSSAIPTYVLSKNTKNHVKVVLTGDGGDEVFGGYNKYYMGKLNNIYTNFISRSTHNSIKYITNPILKLKDDSRGLRYKSRRFLESVNYDGDFFSNIVSLGFQSNELNSLFKNKNLDKKFINQELGLNSLYTLNDFRNYDKNISLEGDMLVKVDRASMLSSIECRSPFLNKELWSFCNSIDEKFLINKWDKKFILKEAFKRYFPNNFLNKSKKGFSVPVGDWLRGSLKQELLKFIDLKLLQKQSIFDSDYIITLVKNHIDSKIDNTFRVWVFYCFQKWYFNIYNKL